MDRLSPLAFRPLEGLINHGIAQSPDALAVAAALDGQSLDVHIDGTSIAMRMVVVDGTVQLSSPDTATDSPAATASLSGPPIAMLRMLSGDPQALIRAGEIRIAGSTDAANLFRELLHKAKPDIEAALGSLLGQTVTHQLGSLVRGLGDFGAHAGETLAQRTSEYFTVEKRSLLTQAELDGFLQDVDTLANDVERATARIARLRNSDA